MKKFIAIILAVFFIIPLVACNGKDEEKTEDNNSSSVSGSIDYDLSKLSTTMAYSQVVEMTNNSSKYLGKRVKITGTFIVEETPQRNYYSCLINDQTACCSVGFEFVLKDTNKSYPDDYPQSNGEITVEGIFNRYNEGEKTYYELIDAVLL